MSHGDARDWWSWLAAQLATELTPRHGAPIRVDASSPLARVVADDDSSRRPIPDSRSRRKAKRRKRGRAGAAGTPVDRRHRPLFIEALEDRVVLSNVVADLSGSTLSLTIVPDSSSSNDVLSVETDGAGLLEYALNGQAYSANFVNSSGPIVQFASSSVHELDTDDANPDASYTLDLATYSIQTGNLTRISEVFPSVAMLTRTGES
jgi:hypothetical protein